MKVKDHFYSPDMGIEIRDYCKSRGKYPFLTEPFSRVSIDLVGPLVPSSEGYHYISTLVDVATGFLEALPLK